MTVNKHRTSIYLPDDLYEKVKRLAEDEQRSLNKQITYILIKYIQDLKEKK